MLRLLAIPCRSSPRKGARQSRAVRNRVWLAGCLDRLRQGGVNAALSRRKVARFGLQRGAAGGSPCVRAASSGFAVAGSAAARAA